MDAAQEQQPSALPAEATALQAIIFALHEQLDQQQSELVQRDRQIAELQAQKQTLEQKQREMELARQQWELEKVRLEHQLELYKKRHYGPRADKVEVGQLLLDFATALEARPVTLEIPAVVPAAAADAAEGQPRRVRRGRRNLRLFEALPKLTKVHDLSEAEKLALAGEGTLVELSPEITWQVEYLPGSFLRIEHVQKKYAAVPAEQRLADEGTQIVLAQKPPQPIDKGMAGPGLLAYVVVSKYGDYLPLYRLQNIFERNGLEIDRSTMSLWCGDVADLLRPVYRLMKQRVLQGHVVATDDTVMPLLAPEKVRQARLWIYRGDDDHPYNIFDFTISRGRDGPNAFLGLFAGVLLADAYGAYGGICLEKQITQAGCWAHARRKFTDCQDLAPTICAEVLALIGKLFAVEKQAKEMDFATRLQLRQQHSAPVIAALEQKLQELKLRLLPKHPLAEAVGYVLNQWGPLTVFLKDGALAIDNNLAEQEMKRAALLRKNALFVGSERGGTTAAILSSMTSTCRRLGINPQRYLTQLLVNLPSLPLSQVSQWLPDVWQKRVAAEDLLSPLP